MIELNENDRKRVHFERIRNFHTRSKIGYLGMLCGVIYSGVLIYPYTSPEYVYAWGAAIVLTYIPRLAISALFTRAQKRGTVTPDNVEKWERRIQLNSFLPFLAYSSLALMPYNDHAQTGFMIAAFSLMNMLAGGILLYRASLKVISLYLYVSFACLIGRCLYEGSTQFHLYIGYLLIFFFLVNRLLKDQFQDFVDNVALRLQHEKASLFDPLTGLANRRQMDAFMERFLPASKRGGQEFQIAMIDIDYFKQYNDEHGHLAGDELLVALARQVGSRVRSGDLFVRYGGEEFALILPACDQESALKMIGAIKERIKKELGISISVGLVSSHNSDDFSELLQLADGALYLSKQKGRDRISCA